MNNLKASEKQLLVCTVLGSFTEAAELILAAQKCMRSVRSARDGSPLLFSRAVQLEPLERRQLDARPRAAVVHLARRPLLRRVSHARLRRRSVRYIEINSGKSPPNDK